MSDRRDETPAVAWNCGACGRADVCPSAARPITCPSCDSDDIWYGITGGLSFLRAVTQPCEANPTAGSILKKRIDALERRLEQLEGK